MKGKQRRVKEDFATIPQAPRYEINSFGVLRNRDTGYILKWQVHKHGHKFMARQESRRLAMQFALAPSRED